MKREAAKKIRTYRNLSDYVASLTLAICLPLLWLPTSLFGQSENKRLVLESADLTISGKTNINEFTCRLSKSDIDTVTAQIATNNDAEFFKGLSLSFNVSDFECDKSLMTNDLKSLLKEDEYPYISMKLNNVTTNSYHTRGNGQSISAEITLYIAGHSEDEVIKDADIVKTAKFIELSGSHQVLMTTFKIDPPTKFFGTVHTEDLIEIFFSIKLR